jgi:hypothetical protein
MVVIGGDVYLLTVTFEVKATAGDLAGEDFRIISFKCKNEKAE